MTGRAAKTPGPCRAKGATTADDQPTAVYFVAPLFCTTQRTPDLVPVTLPHDIGRFLLVATPDGPSIRLRHRRRWCPLGGAWRGLWRPGEPWSWAAPVSLPSLAVTLRDTWHAREATQRDWERRNADRR